ncbi:putative F-box/kelch-repeat protein At3g17540 [Eutrema salsugineum]|nr:putative F-box/kelch-repeat protein At3g17540 [Eutrema salsugineum]
MKFTDLPQEWESEILSRVPATSLYQLRSTCRRWYVLFKDKSFIEENMGKAATQVILKKYYIVYSVSINLQGIDNSFDPSIEFTGKLDSEHVMISTIFHCNGLLLCTTKDNRLFVWNPCTGQTRWIQPNLNRYENDYVLGYESNNKSGDSYKILRTSYYYNDLKAVVVEFAIYELKSDSWRVLDDVSDQNWTIGSHAVSLKGNTYWLAWDDYKFLVRFDFKRERFKRLSLPIQCNDFNVKFSLSVVREEKLSVLLQ